MSHPSSDSYIDTILDYCDEMDITYPEWPEEPGLVQKRLKLHRTLVLWLKGVSRPDYEKRARKAMERPEELF